MAFRADRGEHELTGVHTDPQRQPAELLRFGARALLHLERGAHRTLGVVFVRDRRAPDRENGVTDDLVDVATEALDDLADECRASIDERAHLFVIGVLRER